MIDWDADVLDGIYEELAEPATLRTRLGDAFELAVIDRSAGRTAGTNLEMPTVRPAALVRISDLAALGIDQALLGDGTLTLKGWTWRIGNAEPKPGLGGAEGGELLLWLMGPPEPVEEATEEATDGPA